MDYSIYICCLFGEGIYPWIYNMSFIICLSPWIGFIMGGVMSQTFLYLDSWRYFHGSRKQGFKLEDYKNLQYSDMLASFQQNLDYFPTPLFQLHYCLSTVVTTSGYSLQRRLSQPIFKRMESNWWEKSACSDGYTSYILKALWDSYKAPVSLSLCCWQASQWGALFF